MSTTPRKLGLLLFVCSLFCAMSLYQLAHDPGHWRAPLATLAFFGLGAALFLGTWVEGRATTRALVAEPAPAWVRGSRATLSPRRFSALAAGLGLIGATGWMARGEFGPVWAVLTTFVALVGLGLGVALAFGLHRRQSIALTEAGVTLRQGRLGYCIPWEAIQGLRLEEVYRNVHLLIDLTALVALLASASLDTGDPAKARLSLQKQLARSLALLGAPVALMPHNFGLDPGLLLRALARYTAHPETRAELGEAAALPAGSGDPT